MRPFLLVCLAIPFTSSAHAGQGLDPERLASTRVPFVANQGQLDADVAFQAAIFAGGVFVTNAGEVVYSIAGSGPGWTLVESFARGNPVPSGLDPSSSGVSVFRGADPSRWRSDLPCFDAVSLGEPWPGVRLDLRAHGANVEKLFTLARGELVERIRVDLRGAQELCVSAEGSLVASTALGEVEFSAPVAWQEKDGARLPVPVAYRLDGASYGFTLGEHEPDLPVTIDPLIRSTFLGGNLTTNLSTDIANAVAIEAVTGQVLLAGNARSTNFPGVAGGYQTVNNSAAGQFNDGFVARLSADLSTLVQATYIGGSGSENLLGLFIAPAGVYVCGLTNSSNFPTTAGVYQTVNAGGQADAWIARFNAGLTALVSSTYYGGNGTGGAGDVACDLAVASGGDVFVCGRAQFGLPGTAGGAIPTFSGNGGSFIARFNGALTSLVNATYCGSAGFSFPGALALDPVSGDVLVAGSGYFSPVQTVGTGFQTSATAFGDAAILRINSTLTGWTGATLYGGNDADEGNDLVVSGTSVYLVGTTFSTNLPGLAGGAQSTHANPGGRDAYVARFGLGLTTLTQSTLFGGAGEDYGNEIRMNPASGEVFIAGTTYSPDLPGRTGGSQHAYSGPLMFTTPEDAFIARLASGLTSVLQSTYVGGMTLDTGEALDVNAAGDRVVLAGGTSSFVFPGTLGSAQPATVDRADAFVSLLTSSLASPATPYCFGDGTLATPCPCGNVGAPGRGCENSGTTGGATLFALGSQTPDTLQLLCTNQLQTVTMIFLQGTVNLPAGVAFGDGVRCAGGVLKRLYIKTTFNGGSQGPETGDPSITTRSAALGDTISGGSTRYYLGYYRDSSPTFCLFPIGNTWNSSNGLIVVW